MSYSLKAKCGDCQRFDKCIDYQIIMGGITAIHSLWNKGHLGGGTIDLQCQNFVAKPQEEVK